MLKFTSILPRDELFLYELYASTRSGEFTLLGLPDQQIVDLLRMQYEAQKSSYQHQFPKAKYELIYYEDVRIGRIITDIQSQCIHLVDISLLPEYRGRGYGTQLIKRLQSVAVEKRLPVTLHVLQGNPAQRLYERCGFHVTGEVAPYVAMRFKSL